MGSGSKHFRTARGKSLLFGVPWDFGENVAYSGNLVGLSKSQLHSSKSAGANGLRKKAALLRVAC